MSRAKSTPFRILLALASPTLVAVAFFPTSRDPFEVAKVAVVFTLAGALVALTLRDAVEDGGLRLPSSPWAIALLALLMTGLLAVVTADNPMAAFMGVVGRYSGLGAYASAGLIGAVIAGGVRGQQRDAWARTYILILLIGAAVLGFYGLLQLLGLEPLGAQSAVAGVFVTLSNPNFAGGWAGALLGAALWQALASEATMARRALGAVATAGLLLIVFGAGALTGYLGAAGSVGALGLIWLWHGDGIRRKVILPVTAIAGAGSAALVGMGVLEQGPLAALGMDAGVQLRRHYWTAALSMLTDRPLSGIGFDGFLYYYRGFRSVAAADAVSLSLDTDAAHSAPLQLASGGGLPLTIAYLVLLGVTAWGVLRLLRATTGPERMLAGAVASVWAGVVAQSVGSFDMTSHITLSLVTGGVLAGMAWPERTLVLRIPGVRVAESATSTSRKGGNRKAPAVQHAEWVRPAAAAIGVLIVVVAVLIGIRPTLAEQQAAQAGALAVADLEVEAAMAWGEAARWAFWEADYPYRQGLALLRANEIPAAIAALDEARARQPRHLAALISEARALTAVGPPARAEELFRLAAEVEPTHLDLKAELARVFAASDPPYAQALVEQIRDRSPERADLAELEALVGGTSG